ncbi:MBL fold metallo-hydrolase [Parendozoicomonas sp. Alg238-R29]|uniref:MBL fold metallo-hydrolase n=1 Tax=Parendozoicomonas sp. Alg238-R29 TaxID=2993446 RepID=UPI00248E2011|nr:MBL fold metallo-hydrolase [Parendozoicomonas sp. Alg238-R29]
METRHGQFIKVCLVLLVLMNVKTGIAAYKGVATDHFDGNRFDNQIPTKDKGLIDLMRWRFNREVVGSWAEKAVLKPDVIPVVNQGVRATFINHATVLVQMDGLSILTDPIWSERASPVSFAGPRRYHPPALSMDELPPIDVVVISHNHYDHMDLPTLRELEARFQPHFIVGLGNSELLREEGLTHITEIDWWQNVQINDKVVITGTPAQHWSTRNRLDINKNLWLGFLIKGEKQVFFPGDTGLGPHFKQIYNRYGSVDLALLPIGAYLPRWVMKDNHMSPADAVEAYDQLQTKAAMAIHFGTFDLADDGQTTAADELKRILRQQPGNRYFTVPEPGSVMTIK